jgi:hypothetical protein
MRHWLWRSRRGRAVRAWLWTLALVCGTIGFVVGHIWSLGLLIAVPGLWMVVWLLPREIAWQRRDRFRS